MEVIVILDKNVKPLTRVRVSIKLDISVGFLSENIIFVLVVLFSRLYIIINRIIHATINDCASRELVRINVL